MEAPPSKRIRYDPPKGKPVRTANWREGLRNPAPDQIFAGDDVALIIYDGYPKAKRHLLALAPPGSPLRDVKSVADLRPKHLDALRDFHKRVDECREGLGPGIRLGYHAEPSMNWLHCHLISDDFDSDCLKTKVHWLSFTTPFLVPPQRIEALLADDDIFGTRLRNDLAKRAKYTKASALQCHRCDKTLPTMPALKRHIKFCKGRVEKAPHEETPKDTSSDSLP